jgi:hypothetical protein
VAPEELATLDKATEAEPVFPDVRTGPVKLLLGSSLPVNVRNDKLSDVFSEMTPSARFLATTHSIASSSSG